MAKSLVVDARNNMVSAFCNVVFPTVLDFYERDEDERASVDFYERDKYERASGLILDGCG